VHVLPRPTDVNKSVCRCVLTPRAWRFSTGCKYPFDITRAAGGTLSADSSESRRSGQASTVRFEIPHTSILITWIFDFTATPKPSDIRTTTSNNGPQEVKQDRRQHQRQVGADDQGALEFSASQTHAGSLRFVYSLARSLWATSPRSRLCAPARPSSSSSRATRPLSGSLSSSVSRSIKQFKPCELSLTSRVDYSMLAKTNVHHFSGNNVSLPPY